jgi:phenylacetate-CoA ligase
LQSLALSAEGWRQQRERFGGEFRERLASYLAREHATDDEVLAVRREKLRRLLRHAATIPFWSARFRDAGLDPDRVDGPEDLALLPVLTKSEILLHGTKLVWPKTPRRELRTSHTSGTTGAGLVFQTTREAIRDQWAVWWRNRIRHGIVPTAWSATFMGRSIVSGGDDDPSPWRTNWPGRQVLFSQYHLRPATAASYARALVDMRLPWFHGYPSFIAYLAALIAEIGAPRATPRVITLGAESVLAPQVRVIREVFGVDPIQHYGLAEMVANASQCPAGRLHIDEDFAAVELVPSGDGTCRIVGTSLQNFAMPFIRYDTEDLARPARTPCGCGLPGRVLEAIDGRREDFLELNDGTRVGRLDHLFKDAVHVAEAQIRQETPGRCSILVVPREGYERADRDALLYECRERFGDRLDVEIEVVEAIERSARGKLRLVVRSSPSP